MRKPLIVGNWKMYKTVEESLRFIQALEAKGPLPSQVEAVICPPYTSLYSLSQNLGTLKLGAQNCHWETKGAYTGEVSPVFLKNLQCDYVILGHSERRNIFGETDEIICKKVHAVMSQGLIPIFCIGESEQQRLKGETLKVIEKQLEKGLQGVKPASKIVVAYEPIWAIGTGRNASADEAQEVHQTIRQWLTDHFGKTSAQEIRILYGGSVSTKNSTELMRKPDIDGALIGGASLEVDSFFQIVDDRAKQENRAC